MTTQQDNTVETNQAIAEAMQDIGNATTTFLTTYLEEASKRIEAEALRGSHDQGSILQQ